MSPIVFFSYARGDLEPLLAEFFEDLCEEIAPRVPYEAADERLSFRDKNNIRLMERWKSDIQGALQSTTVLVCVTSIKYFLKDFCGKEYYFFDARRRQGIAAGQDPPAVILPVIWAPVAPGLPDFMDEVQQVPKNVDDEYRTEGLRRLKRRKTPVYDDCVIAFADAIVKAWNTYKDNPITPLVPEPEFDEIPNRFADGDWQEAAGPNGWLPGPEVANFVFAAGRAQDLAAPPGRYGATPALWRPYLPPELTTIREHARNVTRDRFKFREILVSDHLKQELDAAKKRKNLTIVIADPKMLAMQSFTPVRAIQDVWWEGTAVVLPCDDTIARTEGSKLPKDLAVGLPIVSQSSKALLVTADSHPDLQPAIDLTLTTLRNAVTKVETEKKDKTDAPPTDLRAAG